MASISTLRVYVEVPEVYSRSAKPGVGAYLTLTEYPGRQFHGRLVLDGGAVARPQGPAVHPHLAAEHLDPGRPPGPQPVDDPRLTAMFAELLDDVTGEA